VTIHNETINEHAKFTTSRYGCWCDWSFMTVDSFIQLKREAMGIPLRIIRTPKQLSKYEAELATMLDRVDFALSFMPDERLLHMWRTDIEDALDDLPKLSFKKRVNEFIKLAGRFGYLCQSIVETKQRRDTAEPQDTRPLSETLDALLADVRLDPSLFADFDDE